MTRRVKVLSKNGFREHMETNAIREEIIEFINCQFICIEPTGGPDSEPIFTKSHPNVLSLAFDDVECDERKWGEDVQYYFEAKAMTDEQAEKIFRFVTAVPDNNDLIIYCCKGESRSGAVGVFATELYDNDMNVFMFENPQVGPNEFVLKKLQDLALSK